MIFFLGSGICSDVHMLAALWPYSGKRYMQMFPQPQHPPAQHGPHMPPPVPAPMPPPTYDEDSGPPAAAQQPHRGYMYYPPYGYPPQVSSCVIFHLHDGPYFLSFLAHDARYASSRAARRIHARSVHATYAISSGDASSEWYVMLSFYPAFIDIDNANYSHVFPCYGPNAT